MTSLSRSYLVSAAIAAAAVGLPGLARADDDGVATATLEMEPTKLDFEGTKAINLMYFPSGAKLEAKKPDAVKKEPKYRGTPKYATIKLGNGIPNEFVMAFDEPAGQDPKVYVDVNGDGDLTNDGENKWTIVPQAEGKAPQLNGTFVFEVHWKNADGTATSGKYGLNFYRSADRHSINYYRAGARTGKITVSGKTYEVMLREESSDGLFNKLYNPKSGELKGRPVNLRLDGDQFDVRFTFSFAGLNYMAEVSDDGARITLKPTAKVIRPPAAKSASADKESLLKVGAEAPDFSVVAWNPAQKEGDEPVTVKLSSFRGKKVVVIDYWATWCMPCTQALPRVNKLAESLKGQDAVVLAVNSWDDKPAFERYAKTKAGEWALTFVRDPAGKSNDNKDSIATKLFGVHGIPATFVIDKSGKVAAVSTGNDPDDKTVESTLTKLGLKVE